jgi:FtsZ-binding cell division protein ZapB
MTNEERQKLCDWLRHLPAYLSEDGMRAADEIERLAAENERLQNELRLWKEQG